jgi:hypothetical protein
MGFAFTGACPTALAGLAWSRTSQQDGRDAGVGFVPESGVIERNPGGPVSYNTKSPAPATVAANRDAVALFDMDNQQDFVEADRGFIAPWPGTVVSSVDGHVILLSRTGLPRNA